MAMLGLVLMLVGMIFGIPILWSVGIVLLVVGVILWLMGANGHQVGGRRHYY